MLDDLKQLYDEFADLQARMDLLESDKRKLLDFILTKTQKSMIVEIEEEFAEPISTGLEALKNAADALKKAVVASGATFNGGEAHQVIFVKGRVRWDDKKLQDMVFDHPPLAAARNAGNPYATIRVRKTG